MAYTGKIKYLDQNEELEWDSNVTMNNGILCARVKSFKGLEGYKVHTEGGTQAIRFDLI